jgi:hypothetical protein
MFRKSMGKLFNRHIKNFARYQPKLSPFQPNRLNPTLSIERRGDRDVIMNYAGPVFVNCTVTLDTSGLQVDVASDSEHGTDVEILVPIRPNDLLGFSKSYEKPLTFIDEDWLSDELRALYDGWGLDCGRVYRFSNAVIKASDGLVATVETHSSSRFDRAG